MRARRAMAAGPEPEPWYRRANVNVFDCEEFKAAYDRHMELGLIRIHEGRVVTTYS